MVDFKCLKSPVIPPKPPDITNWVRPPENQVKINFDGAFNQASGEGGWGYIIRDQAGDFVAAGSGISVHLRDPLHSEAVACLAAVSGAIRVGTNRIIFESDASNLVQALKSNELDKCSPGQSAEQYLGLLGKGNLGNSSNHVFAVEFDTVQASGLLNETNGNHVGVDLNSLVSALSEPAGYFTDDGGRNVSVPLESAQPIQAWVDYDGRARVLNVTIAPASVSTRPHRPLISHAIDLTAIFKQDMCVGFSAATGKLASSHYILAWSFRTDGVAQSIDLSRLPKVPKTPAPPPSMSTVIMIVALSCAATLVMVVVAIGQTLWLRRRAALAETLEEWELDHPHSQWQPEARPSMRQVCQYLDGEEEMHDDAVLHISNVDSIDFGSLKSLTWSSCATMSAGSLRGGR
ncbi:hypothetical protein ACQ4PT_023206 [Festuca glaucescens]